jgi:hypothetical protein
MRLSASADATVTGGAGTAAQPQASKRNAATRVLPEPPYSEVNQNVQSSSGSTDIPA